MAEDSNSRPSMESMHPLVQYGRSISASGVPNRFSLSLYSHIARPHP